MWLPYQQQSPPSNSDGFWEFRARATHRNLRPPAHKSARAGNTTGGARPRFALAAVAAGKFFVSPTDATVMPDDKRSAVTDEGRCVLHRCFGSGTDERL